MNTPGNTTMGPRCYSSYQHTTDIWYQSHYTCPDTCVIWDEMCRGVSRCEGDTQVCGPDLRCPAPKYYKVNERYKYNNGDFHTVTKLNISSSLVNGHQFCIEDIHKKKNDGKFDSLDRSDETQVRTASQSPLDLNITSFIPCSIPTSSWTYLGVMCGTECKRTELWCREDDVDPYVRDYAADTCDIGSGYIKINDTTLCQDPRLWANVSCIAYLDNLVWSYGFRCTGQNMRCVQPWYTKDNGVPHSSLLRQSPDKSDQVFNSSLTCREHLQQHIDFFTQRFCNETNDMIDGVLPLARGAPCKNITKWLSEKDKSYTDPHSCQSSCSVPGPDCQACSNSSYFLCPRSGQCVHPQLVCDGHPQCVEGEDEDLTMCYEDHIKLKIIDPLATYRCQSLFYENMTTFSIPHNNKIECWDGSDEPENKDKITNIFLTAAILFVMTIYIAMKYSGLAKKILSTDNMNITTRVQSDQIHQNILDFLTLKNYSENHDQSETIENTNIHILNSINTQKVDDNISMCKLFYELEQELHEANVSKIHLCLHKKMDPKVVENIIDSGEPGCTAGCIEGFENCVGRRLIMELQDKITKSPIIKEILGTTIGIIKVVGKFFDLTKDTALSIVTLQAVGSFESVWEFKTNFSCVIVITLFSSILLPLLLSTLHLIVNKRKIIDEGNFSRTRKYVTITLCWIASFLNPIILDAYYNELKEDVRKLTENHDIRALPILRKCRNIRNQIVTFHKIELG